MKRFTAIVCTLLLSLPGILVGAEPPGKLLDLSSWKLTLPVDTSHPGKPDEIEQPELASFNDSLHFFVNPAGTGVVFRAPVGGSATKGSKFPRSELRETVKDSKRDIAWNTAEGTHTLTMRVAITSTPPVKQHVVCAQIHDAEDDLMMVRLEGKKLFVERNSTGDVSLDSDYKLGQPIDLKIQAADGSLQVWYNDELKLTWKTSRKGCYFKAGCYVQSNIAKGDAADSFGEVVIERLHVEHQKAR